MEKYGDLSKSEKYSKYGENAYKLLKPLYIAKESSWSTKDVTSLLVHVFDHLAEKEILKFDISNNDYCKEQFGRAILKLVASLSPDWSWLRARGQNYGSWHHKVIKKEVIKLPTQTKVIQELVIRKNDGNGIFDYLESITNDERIKNRTIWDKFFQDVKWLQEEELHYVFESDFYCSSIFIFNTKEYRSRVSSIYRLGANHKEFVQYILCPLYFNAIYEARSIYDVRIKKVKVKEDFFGESIVVSKKEELVMPYDVCKQCGIPMNLNMRVDAKFCSGRCKSAYQYANRNI